LFYFYIFISSLKFGSVYEGLCVCLCVCPQRATGVCSI